MQLIYWLFFLKTRELSISIQIMEKIEPLDWSQEEPLNPESPSHREEGKQEPSLEKQSSLATHFRNFVKRKSILKKTGLETLYVIKKH